jgi:hypothetical protein
MPTQIYMPLRSNAAWFGDDAAQARLERELKTNLALYDYVLLQDGRVQIVAGNDGQGFVMPHTAASFPGDRTKIDYVQPGSAFGVIANGVQILASTCEIGYEVDFFPIVSQAGYQDATFIRWVQYEPTEVVCSKITSQVLCDLSDRNLLALLPANAFVRKQVLEGLYRDSVVAHGLKVPFTVDFHAMRVAQEQWKRAQTAPAFEAPQKLYRHWLNLNLPDLSQLSWQQLYDFRESDVGRSFREMIHGVTTRAKEVMLAADDQRDLDQWLARELSKELLYELSNRVTTPASTVLSMASNLIPFGCIYGLAKDVSSFDADQNSWVSLVRGYQI